MKKVFLDTNVILDLLLDRRPYSDDIAQIFDFTAVQSIKLCTSSLSIANINYIVARIEGERKALSMTKKILQILEVESVGKSQLMKSANSKFKDFEDGIQNYCALESEHTVIVTRNTKDFKASELAIMNPKEYLTKLQGDH